MLSRGIIVFSILFISLPSYSRDSEIKFRHLFVEDGLSRSWVKCIYQDSRGFLWFGTNDGINRYDGYQFKVYKYDLTKPAGINSNNVNVIYEDKKNNLWVGTQEGLNVYNRDLDKFIPFNVIQNYIDCIYELEKGILLIGSPGGLFLFDSETKSAQQIFDNIYVDAILEADTGNLWLGTYDGLWLLDTKDYSFISFRHQEKKPFSISEDKIRSLYRDSYGNIWIGTNTQGVSLVKYEGEDPNSIKFVNLRNDPERSNSISMGAVLAIHEDAEGNIWIGVENGGISIISLDAVNKENYTFKHLTYNANENTSISNNSIHSLFRDRQNTMWLGTYGAGVSYTNPLLQKFKHYRNIPGNNNSLNNNQVNVIYEDGKYIYFGTEGGLNRYDREKNSFTHYVFDPNDPSSLGSNAVWAICKDSRDNLWIGTWEGGLNLFNPEKQNFTRFTYDEDDRSGIGSNSVYGIIEDREGELWIATMSGGLNKYDYETGTFKHYMVVLNHNSISNNWVMTLLETSDGKIWISTTTAVDVFDKQSGRFRSYTHETSDSTSISYNGAIVLFEDSRNNLWLGTNNGLNLYHASEDRFSHYLTTDGLPDNTIKGICEDNHGNLWLTTNNGISKFINGVNIPDTPVFKNYDLSDGLQGNEFNSRSIFKGKNGIIYAGGTNGFNTFYPDSIHDNCYLSKVVFTDFLIFNKPVTIGEEDSPLEKHIGESEEIRLSHKYSIFSIEFSALNFIASEKNEYAFMLDGFEKEWNYVGTQRMATYTNLDPGKYTFMVKASNSDGLWNEKPTELNIVILPPWWKTNSAKVIYILMLFLALYFFRRYTLISVNLKNRLWLEHAQKEKDEELNQLKFQFFTNISHELRTPLTLIVGPVERLINKGLTLSELEIIKNNTDRLKKLVDQILDFRKIENNMMQLNLNSGEIVSLIEHSINAFLDYAQQKNIRITFSSRVGRLIMPVDTDKFEKILDNLIINALKYTNSGGTVAVKLDTLRNSENIVSAIIIEIADNGKGISPDDQPKIFNRFFTSEGLEDSVIGTGIGLHLTKKFVELHGGTIDLQSEPGRGSVFRIEIPLEGTPDEIEISDEKLIFESSVYQKTVPDNSHSRDFDSNHHKTILIIDDNEEMCNYLKLILQEEYAAIAVTDPVKGMELAIQYMPDIIISDIMMPGIDGFEICRKIKTDIRISHIPIILLTAKATTEDHIAGFETGADDYIYKPFDESLLKSRIKNLIKQRELIKEHLIGSDGSINSEISAGSLDKEFIEKIFESIHNNYMEAAFNVNNIIQDMGLSRSVFYKKLKAISNLSINDLIKNIRMKKAKELLLKSSLTISEVAYDTGFGDPAYFSKVFKEQYKVSPKNFKRQISKL